jgi:small subunit ribosomal protein S15
MAVAKEQKNQIVKKFQRADLDTGSPEVQVALLTARINQLTLHFGTHKKDFHGLRGLVTMVNKRRNLLDYLHRKNPAKYSELIKSLDIRK